LRLALSDSYLSTLVDAGIIELLPPHLVEAGIIGLLALHLVEAGV
jgi:hypothetical protein